MKSSKIQSFWTGFAVVLLVLFGGAGYFFFTSVSSYSSSKGTFNRLKSDLNNLEKAPIYPSDANVKDFAAKLDEYELEVDKLHGLLKTFQKPLQQIPPTQFPQDLKKKIEDFRVYTARNKVAKPDDFYFGMDSYGSSTPLPGSTGILSYQLEAIEHMLHTAIENGADVIYSLRRETADVELGKPGPELSQQVAKYTVTLSFRTTNPGLQHFLNQISTDKDYFYIVRLLRVDSEIGKLRGEPKSGPVKSSDQPRTWIDKATGEVVTDLQLDESGEPPANVEVQDAAPILGNEKLRVTAVVDLCRFPENSN